jgi:hypothetical protein
MRCNDRSSAVSGSLGKKRFSLEVNAAETEEKRSFLGPAAVARKRRYIARQLSLYSQRHNTAQQFSNIHIAPPTEQK